MVVILLFFIPAGKEATIFELKKGMDLQMILMRKRKRVTPLMEEVFDYIEMQLRRDLT